MKILRRSGIRVITRQEKRSWEKLKTDLIEQEYCKQLYLSGTGWTQQKLADLYGVCKHSMTNFCQQKGWKKKPQLDCPQNKRKYNLNDNFFSNENSIMAYWLGFIAADGYCVSTTNELGIGLARIDKSHLEKFKQDLQAENPIKDYINSEGYENSKIILTSKQLRSDLATYGIVPKKTFSLEFPKNLQQEYWIDFIRGYFDGDGSVSYLKNQKAIRWQICGAKRDFLQDIVNFLYEAYDIPKVKIQFQTKNRLHTLYNFQYSTHSSITLFDILYYNNNCRYLDRKYLKFKEAIQQHEIDISS